MREKVPASTADTDEIDHIGKLVTQFNRPERQRGLWSFLTWSFFLAQVMAGDQFLESGARAAQADDSTARSKGHSDSTHNDVPDSPGSGLAAAERGNEAAASQTEAHAAQVGGLFNNLQGSEPGAHSALSNNAGHGDFDDASQAGSGTSGQPNSNGTSQTGSDLNHDGNITAGADLCHVTGINSVLGFDNLPAVDTVLDLELSQVPIQIHGSGDTISQVLHTTLDQTGLYLAESVGGLTALLGDAANNTLSQITGLHLVGDAGEVAALLGGSLDNSLNLALGVSTDALTKKIVSDVTDLASLGHNEGISSGDTVSHLLNTSLGQLAESRSVGNAGEILDSVSKLPLGDSVGAVSAHAMLSGGTPTLNIVSDGLELASLGHSGDISSGGTIAYPDLAGVSVQQVDDLFTGGRYTDYSLALHSDVNSGATAIANTLNSDTSDTSASGALPVIDSPTPGHHSGNAPLSVAQDVETSLVGHLSTIEEHGVRDHLI